MTTFYSQIRDSPNLEGQVSVFTSPRSSVDGYNPMHWVPFSSLPTTRRATVGVFDPASTRDFSSWLQSRVLCYDRRSVGRSVLEESTHLGLTTRCLLLSHNCRFVDVGRSLWREDGSVFYICCWPSLAQSLSDPSPVGLAIVFYCLRFETSTFVASHDSQGHGGGTRPRLHMGLVITILLSYRPCMWHYYLCITFSVWTQWA
jgi:hypothetical protein